MTVRELIDLLMEFPEDKIVYVPDWASFEGIEDKPVQNAVLTSKGIVLDY